MRSVIPSTNHLPINQERRDGRSIANECMVGSLILIVNSTAKWVFPNHHSGRTMLTGSHRTARVTSCFRNCTTGHLQGAIRLVGLVIQIKVFSEKFSRTHFIQISHTLFSEAQIFK